VASPGASSGTGASGRLSSRARAGRAVPAGQPDGDHTMTDRVLLALALALLALTIAAAILYVAGVVPIFV
jgi:hypothetical protein